MPRLMIYVGVLLVSMALLPMAWIYRAQAMAKERPRLHVVPDMDNQPYYRSQRGSDFFADGRAMRPPVEGTVSRGDLREDDAYYMGKQLGQELGQELGEETEAWVDGLPISLDAEQMLRGRERYQIFCAPCHGATGAGDGPISRRANQLAEGTWTRPSDIRATATIERPNGELFDIITHGVRNMPAYDAQIPVADRWAIVAYVRALQRSVNGSLDDVPTSQRGELE